MSTSFAIHKAARIIRNGGVVAYPTEGIFGLGCLPDECGAVERILAIKQRSHSQGLILIAADTASLKGWVGTSFDLPLSTANPVTWIVPAGPAVPPWIKGRHQGVAVRVTAHPVAAALCRTAGSALVSTSANTSGRPPAINEYVLRRQFHALVDYIVPGRCSLPGSPSEIRELESGRILRPARQ